MPTVESIVTAATWDQRVARIRLIPQHHGTGERPAIHAAVARAVYVSHLAPGFVRRPAGRPQEQVRALLECKGTNNGGTARDKALRFERLRDESIRLGGIPLLAVLGGTGWARVNDTFGPVIRDTDGRVFTMANLPEMLTVAPFPTMVGLAPQVDALDAGE